MQPFNKKELLFTVVNVTFLSVTYILTKEFIPSLASCANTLYCRRNWTLFSAAISRSHFQLLPIPIANAERRSY